MSVRPSRQQRFAGRLATAGEPAAPTLIPLRAPCSQRRPAQPELDLFLYENCLVCPRHPCLAAKPCAHRDALYLGASCPRGLPLPVRSDAMRPFEVWLIGYAGDMGGANTECWHTVRLWRSAGWDVHLVPTWEPDPDYRRRFDALGCHTHIAPGRELNRVPELRGKITVGMCNSHYMNNAGLLRTQLGCKIVLVNCMTFFFPHELRFFRYYGLPDAFVYQSEFQRGRLENHLTNLRIPAPNGHLIHGAFAWDDPEWAFAPAPLAPDGPFVLGRCARPDADKWASELLRVYERVRHPRRAALCMGVDDAIRAKLAPVPAWAELAPPRAWPAAEFWRRLHCCLTVNGGAAENWPRVGLECFATGVPVVAERAWGWPEMIEDGRTGFLGESPEELAAAATRLAEDPELRLTIARNARERLVHSLANPERLLRQWAELFASLA